MEKRSEIKKKEKKQKSQKHIFILALIFCAALFLGAIYITDRSVAKLIMSEDNKHAIGFEINNQKSVLNIEIAGEKYSINIKKAKVCFQKVKDYVESRLKKM